MATVVIYQNFLMDDTNFKKHLIKLPPTIVLFMTSISSWEIINPYFLTYDIFVKKMHINNMHINYIICAFQKGCVCPLLQ